MAGDGGKAEKPPPKIALPKTTEAPTTQSGTSAGSSLSAVAEERRDVANKVIYRMTEGAHGTPPLANLAEQRGAPIRAAAARIMRKPSGAQASTGAKVPQGGGSPLSAEVRNNMEPQLGADLSAVRVHTSGESQQAASQYGARAFTIGSDVHFNAGEFEPGSKKGDQLLAHELTHVVQGQKSGVQRKADDSAESAATPADAVGGHEEGEQEVSQPGDPAEQEADAVADHVGDALHSGDKNKAEPGAKGADTPKAAGSPKAPAIGAKLEGVGLKIYRAGNGDQSKLKELSQKEALKLLEKAAANEDGITTTLQAVATSNGGQMKGLEHRLKSLDSLARKISERAEVLSKKMSVEDAVKQMVSKINDALRYTIELSPDTFRKSGAAVKEAMEGKSFKVTAERNFWDTATVEDFPYRGVNMTLKSPQDQVFELQFHTPESFAMKSELHGLYEEWRAKETSKPRKSEITKIMLAKWKTVPAPK